MKKEEIKKNNLPTSGTRLGGGTLKGKKTLGSTEKKILIGSSIGILLTILIGVSYAYIAYSTRQEGINVLETDCISVTMEELTNAINLKNTHPITDEVGKSLKPFRFKLTNTCGVGVDYNVNLEVMETESRIASKNIATKVDENAKSILSNNPTAPITYQESDYTAVEAYTIYSGEIKPYESVEHEVRIWLDESAGNDSQNGTFYSKVVIDARQNQIAVQNFVDYILSDTSKDFEEFSHEATSQTPALTDYRYTGSNPDNYVCFGSEEETCPEDNLYRIIGVIPTQSEVSGEYENRVKLIKNSPYEENESGLLHSVNHGYAWNTINSLDWGTASINIQVLNKVYWNNLGEYQKYISSSLWHFGASTFTNYLTDTPNQFYAKERGNLKGYQATNIYYVSNVSLSYPSDYGYSKGNALVNESMYPHRNENPTWMWDLKKGEWTITPDNTLDQYNSPRIWIFDINTLIPYPTGIHTDYFVIRPTFYLKSNVLYKSGNGTQENPYRISINEHD